MEPQAFKARAHLLKLLGDELIGDDRLAVFELVKNGYDADATEVDVLLSLNGLRSKIVITDNGSGMSSDTLISKWLEIGTDSKRGDNRVRSPKFNRMPLGEKGVGRLAVHKLGGSLHLSTRAAGMPECSVIINWPELIGNSIYLDEAKVKIQELQKPKWFEGDKTGTRIEVSDLYITDWSRRHLRSLKKMVTSLVSPFVEVSGFDVQLRVPGRERDIEDLLEAGDILDRAIWTYDFTIDANATFKWNYAFVPPVKFKSLQKRSLKGSGLLELDINKDDDKYAKNDNTNNLFLQPKGLDGIGPISGSFYVYFRRREVLNAQGSYQQVVDYLDEQTGVRVYRDGMRVFNYGELGEDWLSLNADRINKPGKKIGTNSIIATIDLDLAKSFELKEKTNREGFDENQTYKIFRTIVQSVVEHFHITHRTDRENLQYYIKTGNEQKKPDPATQFTETIESIRKGLAKHGLVKELGGKIDRIESQYMQMREVTMSSGVAGINLAVIFHEVEREVKALHKALANQEKPERLLARSEHLSKLLEGFAPLLKRNQQKDFNAALLVKRVLDLTEHRFKYHKIVLSSPLGSKECPDFQLCGPFGLLQASLSNILDNSIHWTRWRREKENELTRSAVGIFSLNDWFEEGPALVVADNGPGFSLEPDEAVQPFVTTRPGGMGLGLYYANMVMETIGGRLLIMTPEELDLPKVYDGAAVVMLFKGGKR